MTKLRLCFILLAATLMAACSSDDDKPDTGNTVANVNRNDASKEPALQRLEFPKVKGGNSRVIIHSCNDDIGINYSVEWDCEKKSQRWSCYQMNSKTLAHNTSRYTSQTNLYPMDPMLPANQYLSKDCFYGSGFDHGHICPSADRLYSAEANKQTFYLTNMQPQYKAFNGSLSDKERHKNEWSPWYRLESQVRVWANTQNAEMLYVVKGGTIEDDQILPNMLYGEMRVPKYFFVALLQKYKQSYRAIGFWMEHKSNYEAKLPLGNYAVNIDELERLTGIDFFCNLPDDIENEVEAMPLKDVKWLWNLEEPSSGN